MSDPFLKLQVYTRPLSYVTPPFPSLYWPFPINGSEYHYLYDFEPMWRFTFYWTLIIVGGVHMAAAGYALLVQARNWKWIWIAPLVYALVGTIEAVIAGNIVGGLLGAVYTAGFFRMSTWIPFTWGLINALVLVLSSFSVQSAL